jgi:hypothetical protein
VGWKAAAPADPWAAGDDDPKSSLGKRHTLVAVVVGVAVVAFPTAAVIGIRPAARMIAGCASRPAAVASAARSLGLNHISHVTYEPAYDGAWIARFHGMRSGVALHAYSYLDFHYRWFGDCFSPTGSAVE